MDIKHVVNATAVITLGKDMVFRDYVQGAYRMRGIGQGQKIHLYIIPEVADLMRRELLACGERSAIADDKSEKEKMLLQVVAWLVINSMQTEQMQWSMLCLQVSAPCTALLAVCCSPRLCFDHPAAVVRAPDTQSADRTSPISTGRTPSGASTRASTPSWLASTSTLRAPAPIPSPTCPCEPACR